MTEDRMIGWHFTNSTDMSLSKLRKIVKDREAWCAVLHGVTKSWTWLSHWTTATTINHNGKEYKEREKKLFLLIRVNICRWDQCLVQNLKHMWSKKSSKKSVSETSRTIGSAEINDLHDRIACIPCWAFCRVFSCSSSQLKLATYKVTVTCNNLLPQILYSL